MAVTRRPRPKHPTVFKQIPVAAVKRLVREASLGATSRAPNLIVERSSDKTEPRSMVPLPFRGNAL